MRLQEIQGPTHELPPVDSSERKFSGRSRLYIGNINNNISEDKIKDEVAKFGEIGELFYNSEKHFAFLRLDYRENAEKAKRELDGKLIGGKNWKVKFAFSTKMKTIQELLHLSITDFSPKL